jgi:hypothetical protein
MSASWFGLPGHPRIWIFTNSKPCANVFEAMDENQFLPNEKSL